MISPQLAVALDWERIQRYASYSMEPKLDGVRCIVEKDSSGVQMYTRTGNDLTEKFEHLVELFKAIGSSFVLDGELGYIANQREFGNGALPIIDFNRTMRVVGSSVLTARMKQSSDLGVDSVQFFPFDMLGWRSDDLRGSSQSERRFNLQAFWALKLDEPWIRANVNMVDVLAPRWSEDDYFRYVQAGGEGVILKNPAARYVEGKRPANNWYKVKRYDSLDVQITGYTEGLGKYQGQIGAIEFEYQGKLTRCSGMDDITRALISQNRDWYKGRWIEVRHFGFVGDEGLRFPQFLRFRFDKDES